MDDVVVHRNVTPVSNPETRMTGTDEFDFELPTELIAQQPLEERTAARMMVVDRATGSISHSMVSELPVLLRQGDLLVLNDTRVIPARVFGRKAVSGGKVELLFLEELQEGVWSALCGAGRRPPIGTRLILADGHIIVWVTGWDSSGRVTVRIEGDFPLLERLALHGVPPLPPYIKRKGMAASDAARHDDRNAYQTVYARVPGAVAAPTAGLHFTTSLLSELEGKGIRHAAVTLHVGMGTFKPVNSQYVQQHIMESERYDIPLETASAINRARDARQRIVAVGSTVVRTLESAANPDGRISPSSGRTQLFIHPPYSFRVIDVMLTNFHLPRSTLLMMVSALAGADLVRTAYQEAIRHRYRFYSYGDCMLII